MVDIPLITVIDNKVVVLEAILLIPMIVMLHLAIQVAIVTLTVIPAVIVTQRLLAWTAIRHRVATQLREIGSVPQEAWTATLHQVAILLLVATQLLEIGSVLQVAWIVILRPVATDLAHLLVWIDTLSVVTLQEWECLRRMTTDTLLSMTTVFPWMAASTPLTVTECQLEET